MNALRLSLLVAFAGLLQSCQAPVRVGSPELFQQGTREVDCVFGYPFTRVNAFTRGRAEGGMWGNIGLSIGGKIDGKKNRGL